jgi:acetylornithine deacetylase/succinyl-diaminopimelate desuccinylase-like protein
MSQPDTRPVLERVEREKERYLAELQDYLRIPSISTDPDYRDEVLRASEFLRERMTEAGISAEAVSPEDGGGYPLVYGERIVDPRAPTVLFYGHYDVQPPDPLDLWRSPPFEPTVEDGFLVARGATDDKGQSYTHVKAVEAMLAERGELPVNVKFLVEGEEESGGASIERFVREDGGSRLAADCVVISDTSMYAPGQPSLIYGLKGLCYMEVKVTGPDKDLHSGTFGGGVTNPLNALCHIVSRLWDAETGKVTIPGFYDDVRPLEDWERKAFAELPFDEAEYARSLGLSETHGEEGYTTRERVWGRPTCDVNGIFGGYQGKGAKTVIASWGGAKVSMRLVPDQKPADIARKFTEHVRRVAPPGVTVEVTDLHGAQPTLLETEGTPVEAAAAAMEAVWGARPVLVREGGSIPIVSTFSEVLDVPVLMMGFGLPDDGLHSPNERFKVENFYQGIGAVAIFLDELAARAAAP